MTSQELKELKRFYATCSEWDAFQIRNLYPEVLFEDEEDEENVEDAAEIIKKHCQALKTKSNGSGNYCIRCKFRRPVKIEGKNGIYCCSLKDTRPWQWGEET